MSRRWLGLTGALIVVAGVVGWSLGRRSEAARIERDLMPERFVRFDPLLRNAPNQQLIDLGEGRLTMYWSWPAGWGHWVGHRTATERCLFVDSGILWPGVVACCPWETPG